MSAASPQAMHVAKGVIVTSPPPSPVAYEAYLRARLAMLSSPPALDRASELIDVAVRHDPHDPQLWTARAEIQLMAGEIERARASVQHALQLRPGYREAEQVMARVDSHARHVATTGTPQQSAQR